MLDSPTLAGHLVLLEPIELGHLEGLTAACSDTRDTFHYTGVPHDEASAHAYIVAAEQEREAGTSLPYAVVDRRRSHVVGSTRFMRIQYWNWPPDSPHQRGTELPDGVEIGATWLSAGAQRTGINTEAKLLMLTHAFETWRVHRVRLTTDERNARSRDSIERLGARLDGVLRADHAAYDGHIRHSAYYSILDSEWPGIKQALSARLRLN